MKKIFTLLTLTLACSILTAQNTIAVPKRHCGTVQPVNVKHEAFEQWMQTTIEKSKQFANAKKASVVYTIPIIFHVIHSGTVTPARNISLAQINSQITSLNNDYRKLNTDFSTYVTQPAFVNAAADVEINFCTAKVNQSGVALTEPGIERINVTSMGWNALPYGISYMESTVKPATIWDPSKYFNVWIIQFNDNTLGYAQFPTIPSGTLPITDMVGQGGSANTDGVVIDYRYTGNSGSANAPYNKGRTLTHETGHWLGLWHIWGDDDGQSNQCSGTDYVTDTPNEKVANYACPTAGSVQTDTCTPNSPGVNYQNYMDYSDDKCMVMFTTGQKARIQAVMANCARRNSLATSTVCTSTGVEETVSNVNVSIYPNPTNGELFVTVDVINPQDIVISVINTLGQTVREIRQTQSTGGTIKIDLSDKTAGVYFVTLKYKSGTFSKRIILQ